MTLEEQHFHPVSSSSHQGTYATTIRDPGTCMQLQKNTMRRMLQWMLLLHPVYQSLAYYTHLQARIMLLNRVRPRNSLQTCEARVPYNYIRHPEIHPHDDELVWPTLRSFPPRIRGALY